MTKTASRFFEDIGWPCFILKLFSRFLDGKKMKKMILLRKCVMIVCAVAFVINVVLICQEFFNSENVVTKLEREFKAVSDEFYPKIIVCNYASLNGNVENVVDTETRKSFWKVKQFEKIASQVLFATSRIDPTLNDENDTYLEYLRNVSG